MGRAVVLSFLLLALLPAAVSPSGGATSATVRTLRTKALVRHISADGARVAVVATSKEGACDARIIIWNAKKRSNKWFAASGSDCRDPEIRGEIPQIALTNKRITWLSLGGGNSLLESLITRELGGKKNRLIAFTGHGGLPEFADGDWIGNVTGYGNLVFYNRWDFCTAYPEGLGPDVTTCKPPSGDEKSYRFTRQRLVKWQNGGSRTIAIAPDVEASSLKTAGQLVLPYSLAVVSVDADRIATQTPAGPVVIYSASGAVLAEIAVPSGKSAGTALQGSQLVTLRNNKIGLYRVSSGALVKTIPVARGSVLRDLQSGLVVYVSKRKIHVLRLLDGRNVTYAPPGSGPVDAQIERSGLFYSYNTKSALYLMRFPNTKSPGRVVFVPLARVLKKLG